MYAYACVDSVSQSSRRLSGNSARVIGIFLLPSCSPVGMMANAKHLVESFIYMHSAFPLKTGAAGFIGRGLESQKYNFIIRGSCLSPIIPGNPNQANFRLA